MKADNKQSFIIAAAVGKKEYKQTNYNKIIKIENE